jgi:hypothetical protein
MDKNILSLIAKNTIGSQGVGGYLSDRLKQQANIIKKRIDPRNLARTLGGKGLIGDVAESSVDKLMSGIGFAAKLGSKKLFGLKNKRNKNPLRSSFGQGPIKPLKIGDSTADILGKMYNFMKKNDELKKQQREIDNAFRQEQIDEDNRRHKALVDAIKRYMGVKPSSIENKKKGSILDLIKDLIPSLESLVSALALLANLDLGIKFPPRPKIKPNSEKNPKVQEKIKTEIEKNPKVSPAEKPAGKIEENKPRTYEREPLKRPGTGQKRGPTTKAERLGRNDMTPPKTAEKVPSEASKSSKLLKGVKLTNAVLLRGINGILDLLGKIPGLNAIAVAADLSNELLQLKDDVFDPNRTATNEELLYRAEKIGAKFLGGLGGIQLGGTIGAAVGTEIGGPWGTLIGGFGGAALGATAGEELFGALFQRYATGKWPEIDYPKAQEYMKENGYVIGEGGAAFGTQVKGLKKITPKLNVPDKKIPVSIDKEVSSQMNQSNDTNVAVNNITKTIKGTPSKVLSVNSARQRNSDLESVLRNSSVAV